MSGNPEKPPIPAQDPEQQQQQQYYPPPPPGGPPAQQDYQAAPQSATSDVPPSYDNNNYQQPPPEKAPVSAHPDQGQTSFPPPPPGPPPIQTEQSAAKPDHGYESDYYNSSPRGDGPAPPLPGPRPTHQEAANYGAQIPAYNPANPQFAPPPGQDQQQHAPSFDPPPQQPQGHGQGHGQGQGQGQADPLAYGQYHPQQGQQGQPQEKQHRSWGHLLSEMGNKAAAPINALANKMGSQSFLPTTMDKECDKAAHILKSFCKEGITSDAAAVKPDETDPKVEGDAAATATKEKKPRKPHGQTAIVKIPSKVINKAQGLAIFTTARAGFNFSGATGSGILIARRPDGSWSPPSGIQVHSLGAGFMIGVDIYDCVCVINSREALAAFMSTRVSLGPDVAVTAGPYGAGGIMDVGGSFQSPDERKAAEAQKAQLEAQQANDHVTDKPGTGAEDEKNSKLRPGKGHQRRSSSMSFKPVFTYVKSRGFYAGVSVDGTVITERKEANAAFYGHKASVEQILRGDVPASGPMWPTGATSLYEALRVAEAQAPLPDANMPPPPSAGEQPAGAAGQAPPHGYGQPQQAYPAGQAPGPDGQYHMSGGGAAGPAGGEQLPGYVNDGVQRPGVGDEKIHYA